MSTVSGIYHFERELSKSRQSIGHRIDKSRRKSYSRSRTTNTNNNYYGNNYNNHNTRGRDRRLNSPPSGHGGRSRSHGSRSRSPRSRAASTFVRGSNTNNDNNKNNNNNGKNNENGLTLPMEIDDKEKEKEKVKAKTIGRETRKNGNNTTSPQTRSRSNSQVRQERSQNNMQRSVPRAAITRNKHKNKNKNINNTSIDINNNNNDNDNNSNNDYYENDSSVYRIANSKIKNNNSNSQNYGYDGRKGRKKHQKRKQREKNERIQRQRSNTTDGITTNISKNININTTTIQAQVISMGMGSYSNSQIYNAMNSTVKLGKNGYQTGIHGDVDLVASNPNTATNSQIPSLANSLVCSAATDEDYDTNTNNPSRSQTGGSRVDISGQIEHINTDVDTDGDNEVEAETPLTQDGRRFKAISLTPLGSQQHSNNLHNLKMATNMTPLSPMGRKHRDIKKRSKTYLDIAMRATNLVILSMVSTILVYISYVVFSSRFNIIDENENKNGSDGLNFFYFVLLFDSIITSISVYLTFSFAVKAYNGICFCHYCMDFLCLHCLFDLCCICKCPVIIVHSCVKFTRLATFKTAFKLAAGNSTDDTATPQQDNDENDENDNVELSINSKAAHRSSSILLPRKFKSKKSKRQKEDKKKNHQSKDKNKDGISIISQMPSMASGLTVASGNTGGTLSDHEMTDHDNTSDSCLENMDNMNTSGKQMVQVEMPMEMEMTTTTQRHPQTIVRVATMSPRGLSEINDGEKHENNDKNNDNDQSGTRKHNHRQKQGRGSEVVNGTIRVRGIRDRVVSESIPTPTTQQNINTEFLRNININNNNNNNNNSGKYDDINSNINNVHGIENNNGNSSEFHFGPSSHHHLIYHSGQQSNQSVQSNLYLKSRQSMHGHLPGSQSFDHFNVGDHEYSRGSQVSGVGLKRISISSVGSGNGNGGVGGGTETGNNGILFVSPLTLMNRISERREMSVDFGKSGNLKNLQQRMFNEANSPRSYGSGNGYDSQNRLTKMDSNRTGISNFSGISAISDILAEVELDLDDIDAQTDITDLTDLHRMQVVAAQASVNLYDEFDLKRNHSVDNTNNVNNNNNNNNNNTNNSTANTNTKNGITISMFGINSNSNMNINDNNNENIDRKIGGVGVELPEIGRPMIISSDNSNTINNANLNANINTNTNKYHIRGPSASPPPGILPPLPPPKSRLPTSNNSNYLQTKLLGNQSSQHSVMTNMSNVSNISNVSHGSHVSNVSYKSDKSNRSCITNEQMNYSQGDNHDNDHDDEAVRSSLPDHVINASPLAFISQVSNPSTTVSNLTLTNNDSLNLIATTVKTIKTIKPKTKNNATSGKGSKKNQATPSAEKETSL